MLKKDTFYETAFGSLKLMLYVIFHIIYVLKMEVSYFYVESLHVVNSN